MNYVLSVQSVRPYIPLDSNTWEKGSQVWYYSNGVCTIPTSLYKQEEEQAPNNVGSGYLANDLSSGRETGIYFVIHSYFMCFFLSVMKFWKYTQEKPVGRFRNVLVHAIC